MTEIAWYWQFLGIQPGASKADIKSAYHRLAKLLHRDHGGTDQDMIRLNEAYHLAMSDNGPAHQEPPRPKPPPPPPPRPQAARAHMFNSPRKWRPLFIGACIGLGVGAVRSIITYDAWDLFGGAMGGMLFGAMYERWEWFVYTVRTKFAKKTKIDRRLVLAVFIGFWTLVALMDFVFSSAPTPTAVSRSVSKPIATPTAPPSRSSQDRDQQCIPPPPAEIPAVRQAQWPRAIEILLAHPDSTAEFDKRFSPQGMPGLGKQILARLGGSVPLVCYDQPGGRKRDGASDAVASPL